MWKLFKNAIKTTNDNIILTIPLILFMYIVGAYLGFSKWTADTLPEIIVAIITMLFMSGAFFAGWLYMVKKAVLLSKEVFVLDSDRAKATMNLVREIPTGIGRYFLSFMGMTLIFGIIISVFGSFIYFLGAHLIGNITFNPEQITQAMGSAQDMRMFLDSLSEAQLIKLSNWNLLFMVSTSILAYLMMLWVPEIIFCKRNPFLAFFTSVKKLFIRPFKSLKLFIFITFLNFSLSFISTFTLDNPLLYFVMMIGYFYFLVYMVVLLFTYYESEFCNNDKCGKGNTGNNGDNGLTTPEVDDAQA